MARHRPEKKREPQAAADAEILPMQFQIGDRLADETGEWEVTGRRSAAGRSGLRRLSAGHPAVKEYDP